MNRFIACVASRNLRSICAFLVAAALAASAVAAQHSDFEEKMVGTWYGEFAPEANAPLQRFLTTRKDDGTFTLQARVYQGNKLVAEARNAGLWGVSNGMYFTVTTEVNGTRSDPKVPEAINAYLVQSMQADRFEYVHFATGRRFVVTRVDGATARLPD